MLAMDEGGTSDPYIILSCGATKKRTKVINKTLHPQYHEDFDFFFPAGTQIPSMEVEMWDRDASSRDDFMGKAVVAVGGLTGNDQHIHQLKIPHLTIDCQQFQRLRASSVIEADYRTLPLTANTLLRASSVIEAEYPNMDPVPQKHGPALV